MQEQIREQVQGLRKMLIKNFDIEGRRLPRGKCIHFTAECVNFAGDVRRGP